jgi:prepilin-type N-terminal cleavage/methylation domain-containing protein
MHSIKNTENGFTLVELLVSIVVGAMLLVSVNTIYTTQIYLAQSARDTFSVNSYAEGKVEALRSEGYLSLANGTNDITSELPSELNAPRSATLIISNQSTSIKKVVLNITYNQQGKIQNYSYSTFLGELGVGQY